MTTEELHIEAPCAVVYEMDVDPENCDALVLRALEDGEHLTECVPGFIEARVLASDSKNRVTIYAAWETRHDWSRAQWDEILASTLVKLHELAKEVRFTFYSRREIVTGSTQPA